MKYTLKGNLIGANCDDHFMPVSNTTVRLYRSRGNVNEATAMVAAQAKETFQIVDEKGIKAKEKFLLAETKTDKSGHFVFNIDGTKTKYQGEAVEVDIHYSKIPEYGQKDTKALRSFKPFQATLNVLQPKWRETNTGLEAQWNYRISHKLWCYILSLLDIWVICGVVLNCETQQVLAGIEVIAMDDDIISDDLLGSAIADTNGHFCIYYRSRDFKKTFLSPIINVETPLFPWGNGPDIYFKFAYGGSVFYEEPPSRAREADRENVGNCFCVRVCVPLQDGGTNPDVPIASAWTGIGTAFTIPFGINLNDFDAQGYAGSLKYGCYGSVRPTGQVAISSTNKALQGNPYEYRFLISDSVVGVNGNPPLNPSNFTKVAGVDSGLFVPTKIGQMWYTGTPFKIVDVNAELADLDGEGWLDVNKSVLRTFNDDPTLNAADLANTTESAKWHWIDLDGMMAINTAVLTNNSMPPVGTAGDAIPVAQRKPVERIAIRFELREVIDKATNNFNYLPGSGQTLNVMVVNNTAPAMAFEIKQHLTGSSCDALSGDIDVAYTAHHPELEDVSINIRSNDNAINQNLTGPGLPIVNNINPALNHQNNASLAITGAPNNIALKTCSYIATLSVKRRLHNGDSGVGTNQIQKSFYYTA